MDNVATHVRQGVRIPRPTPEQYEPQVKTTPKDRLHSVEEFVEQLEQAIVTILTQNNCALETRN